MKIAISGKAGSGKTTLAEIFVKKYGFTRTGFANAVKQVGMEEHGLSWDEAFGDKKNREVLQAIGHGRRVQYGEDYWVNKFFEQIKDMDNIVVDDVRYMNEYEILKKNGFITVRIDSPENVRRERIPRTFPKDTNHQSEIDLDSVSDWHVFINNVGPVDRLDVFADKIYKSFINNNDNV